MKLASLIAMIAFFAGSLANAQVLTLDQYLEQVRGNNPEARAAALQVEAATLKYKEADAPIIPQLYAEYDKFDQRLDQVSKFAQTRTEGDQWKAGIKKQFSFGLETDVYFKAVRSNLHDAPAMAFNTTNFMESKTGLDLKLPLWSNGFGDSVRASMAAKRSALRAEEMKAKMALKNILLQAEDTYWNLVSQNHVIKLQEENVERSGKLRDLMRRKYGSRLVDDVDSLQALASHETRELELMVSRDERAVTIRQFNTLRNMRSESVESLSAFPEKEFTAKIPAKPGVTREDFLALIEEARAQEMKARASRSDIQPKLDLVASYGSNGIDGRTSYSYAEAQELRHPFWNVGLRFSVALDVGKISDIRKGYDADRRAARDRIQYHEFNFERTYKDLVDKFGEAQKRYEKSTNLERVQTDLVKRERQRLLNGRTTTFQAITFEQNLAAAQIQRVKAQQALVQIYNVLKTFEVQP